MIVSMQQVIRTKEWGVGQKEASTNGFIGAFLVPRVEDINYTTLSPPAKLMTFSNTPPSSTVLAASLMSLELSFISQMTGSVVRKVPTSSLLTHLEFSHSYLLSGSPDGYIRIHDAKTGMGRSGGAENLARAHVRSVQGLQASGNYIFTIGMGERYVK